MGSLMEDSPEDQHTRLDNRYSLGQDDTSLLQDSLMSKSSVKDTDQFKTIVLPQPVEIFPGFNAGKSTEMGVTPKSFN